jgi:hypothetical protein
LAIALPSRLQLRGESKKSGKRVIISKRTIKNLPSYSEHLSISLADSEI